MSTHDENLPPAGGPPPGKDPSIFMQEMRHNPLSARVPERVARGVMATGVLVLDGPNEFVLDFVQGLARPFQIATRIVLSPAVMEQFVSAVHDNLQKYEARFGSPPAIPKPPNERRPTIQEIYDEFKMPDDQLSGTYANAVMIGHSPSEFFIDFITNLYPVSAVSARVFIAAAQYPRMVEAVTGSLQRFKQRRVDTPPPPPRPEQPPGGQAPPM